MTVEKTEASPNPKKKFRISARKIFLTYSQVPIEATKEELLKQLQHKVDFDEYVIGKESHQDGGIHFHALLVASKKKFSIKRADLLDVQLHGKVYHGNYGKVRHFVESAEYVAKGGDYISNLESIQNGKMISPEGAIIQRFKKVGRRLTLLEHLKNDPKKAIGKTDLLSLNKTFNLIEQLQAAEPEIPTSPYKIENFIVEEGLRRWLDSDQSTTLILVGPAASGKTQFSRAYAQAKELKSLTLSNLQGLSRLTPEHQCLLFDDCSFANLQIEQLLGILEIEYPKDIRILYGVKQKPSRLIQIIAMNPEGLKPLSEALKLDQVLRRINVVEVPKNFIQVQLSIQVNIHIDKVQMGSNQPELEAMNEGSKNQSSLTQLEPAPLKHINHQQLIDANRQVLNRIKCAAALAKRLRLD